MNSLSFLAQAASTSGTSSYVSLGVQLALLFAVFYFFIIRPQQKRAKDHKLKLESIKRGDEVVTGGGLLGKVVRVDDETMEIELAKGMTVRALRSTISDVRPKGAPAND